MDYFEVRHNIPVEMESARETGIAELSFNNFESFLENEEGIAAYLPEDLFDRNMPESFEFLNRSDLKNTTCSYKRIKLQNRNNEWEKNFNPTEADKFCYVRAKFHRPCSGFYHHDLDDIMKITDSKSFKFFYFKEKNKWAAALFEKIRILA
ncbi:MAG TPA: hypothetical protein VMW76_08755 [Bacteroidales bacterium]|nr:hypothetical protein [Bacteroidales bacterium]